MATSYWSGPSTVGGLLNEAEDDTKRWARENPVDAAALALGPFPVVGDVAGLLNDARHYATDPSSRTWANYGLTALGVLPLVPPAAGTLAKTGKKATQAAERVTAYHASPASFDQFDPSLSPRKASFFAATPEQAKEGAIAGAGDYYGARKKGDTRIYEVAIDPSHIQGLNLTPAEADWFQSLPRQLSEDEVVKAVQTAPTPFARNAGWDTFYDELRNEDGTYTYVRKDAAPSVSYADAAKTDRDVYGKRFPHYGGDEAEIARRVAERGMKGYAIQDEAGLSLAVTDPSIIEILKKYGLLLPGLLGGAAAVTSQDEGS